jgi:hypothetical protein
MRPKTLLVCFAAVLAACGDSGGPPPGEAREPDHIVIDHILISVRGPSFPTSRSEAEARAIAYDLLAKLKAGADWAAAKKEHSEDTYKGGGPYALANHGVAPLTPDEEPRGKMVPAFGDVGFALGMGEIRIADYDAKKSPFGFHVIRRVK